MARTIKLQIFTIGAVQAANLISRDIYWLKQKLTKMFKSERLAQVFKKLIKK